MPPPVMHECYIWHNGLAWRKEILKRFPITVRVVGYVPATATDTQAMLLWGPHPDIQKGQVTCMKDGLGAFISGSWLSKNQIRRYDT